MRTLSACCALLVAGCATSVPDGETSLDLARLAGTSIALRPGGLATGAVDAALLAIGVLPAGFHSDADGTVLGTRDGVVYRYAVSACERCGVPGPCDWFTTSATVVAGWSGAVHQPDLDVQTVGEGTWQVTRMCKAVAGPPVVTGTSAIALTALIGDERHDISEQLRHSLKVQYLFLPPPPQLAGTVQIDIAGTTGEAALAYTPTASLILDGELFELDLVSGAVEPAFPGE